MTLPDKIVKHRKASGWSQEEFAEKLYVSRQAVSRWENGTALPDAQNILQISKLFHVTTDYLLNDDYESDGDIPAVKTAEEETETIYLKKKRLHLIAAICFTIAAFAYIPWFGTGFVGAQVNAVLSLASAGINYALYFKKR